MPITYTLIDKFNLQINIFKAKVTPETGGILGLELTGKKEKVDAAFTWIKKQKIKVLSIVKEFKKYDEKCIDCGFCVSMCPIKAISQDSKTLEVSIDRDKCIMCGACAQACPLQAIDCKN